VIAAPGAVLCGLRRSPRPCFMLGLGLSGGAVGWGCLGRSGLWRSLPEANRYRLAGGGPICAWAASWLGIGCAEL